MKRLMFLLLLAGPVYAAAQMPALSLDQTIQLALQNNGDIQSSQLTIEANRELKRTAFDIGKTTVLGTFGQYNSYAQDNNITVTQGIPFTAFGSQAALNKSVMVSGELKKTVTVNEVRYRVKQVFYQINFLQARNNLLRQQDSLYTGFVKAASLRYGTGESNLLEKTTAETQRNEVVNQLHVNESNMIVLRTQLMTLINARLLPEIEFAASLEIKPDDQLDTTMVVSNPTLAYLQQHIDLMQNQKHLESAHLAPDLLIGFFTQTLIRTPNPENGAFATKSARFNGFQIGVAVPLWFVPQRGRIRAAEFNRLAAKNNYQYYRKTVTGEAEQGIQRYLQGRNSLHYYKTSALPNADLILRQSQSAFRNGEIGYAEYLLGVRSAISIKEGYLQTLNDYNQSIIYLDYLSGVK